MSKIDELRETYSTAYQTKLDSYDYDEAALNCIAEAERAGIAAVVRALRDEMTKLGTLEFQDGWAVLKKFDQLLGAAGDEVAGTVTAAAEAMPEAIERTAPATDPAPAVCEWTDYFIAGVKGTHRRDEQFWVRGCDTSHTYKHDSDKICPSCGKPIKFTEAKT